MRSKTTVLGMTLMLAACAVSTAWAEKVGGEIKLGGIIKDETDGSDLTTMPETFNIYDGFCLSQVKLNGRLGEKSFFNLDAREINQKSGRGTFSYRVPGLVGLNLRYAQHRQLFDPAGSVASRHKDLRGSLVVTPSRAWKISADFGHQRKTGDRLVYPMANGGFLGTSYDYKLNRGKVEAEGRAGSRALAVGYEYSKFTDEDLAVAERKGQVVSVRANGPCYLAPNLLSHFVRASYGKQELTNAGTDYEMGTFQYLGVVKPTRDLRFKYRYFASRVDDKASHLKTDEIRNDLDLTWYSRYGSLMGGYGYVTNDNEVSLTRYETWRAGGTFHWQNKIRARVGYASSDKLDKERLTLLQDAEASRFSASLQGSPVSDLTLGVGYVDREREFPLVGVSTEGQRYNAFARLEYPGWGSVSVDYSYSDDKYRDMPQYDGRAPSFRADDSAVTGRVDFQYIKDLRLTVGATYLNIGKDLDIEKSILSFEGHYDLLKDYFVEVKYNVYNYDDYVLLDRYYTANVVWLNVGYRLSID